MVRHAKLDCKNGLNGIVTFLSANRGLVANFPNELRKDKDSVAAFVGEVAKASRIAQDCLVKEPTPQKELIEVFLRVNKFHGDLTRWADAKQPLSTDFETALYGHLQSSYREALDASSLASKSK